MKLDPNVSPAVRRALVHKWLRDRQRTFTKEELKLMEGHPDLMEPISMVKKAIGAKVIE